MKRVALALLLAGLPALGLADLIPGPPAPENVLLIYTNVTGYNVQLKDAFKTALIAAGATVTELLITAGDGGSPGFYNELVAQTGQTSLMSWCQVYDLRFRDDKNNLGFTGQAQEDVITYLGPNNDTLLFTNYLNAGGSLFLQGEHHDYYIRDTNLFLFINSVATIPTTQPTNFADVYTGSTTGGGFPAAPENFNTDFNNISAGILNMNFPGGINTANRGSGVPIGANVTGAYWGAMNTALAWLPGSLKTNGRLVVSFETNAYTEPALKNATSDAWIQNVYDLLSGCYRYTVTKAFTPANVCVGDTGSFSICYQNTGNRALSNIVISDTLPGCISYNSSSPAASGSSGNLRWWNIGSVASGASACVTVNYTAVSMPPCP